MRPHLLKTLLLSVLLVTAALAQKDKEFPEATPKPPAETPLEDAKVFCVFGDTRPDGDARRLGLVRHMAAAMAAEKPEVVLGTGDYVDGAPTLEAARQQYEAFFQALLPLQRLGPVSLAAAPGNHDMAGGRRSLFNQLMGPSYYSFDLEGAHFVILDTEQSGATGRIDGEQWDWLCQDLAAAQDSSLIFIALHQPLFPVAIYRGEALDKYPKYRDRLHMLFVRAGVNAVFQGHEHLYNHQKRDGVNYFITAGGGAPLYASSSRGGFYHYLKVSFTKDEYQVTVKRLEP